MEYNVNSPQIGMSMTPPSLLKEGQFLILVNGNIQAVDGNFAMITNDSSNLLGTRFKEGFKVIGTNVVPSLSTTFFFLHSPITEESEIGFLFDTSSPDKPDAIADQCCENQIVESTPLEQTAQNPISPYYTFVNASCLNFDVDHPVTSWIKIDDCNIRIYFNDFKNPPRYIDYKDFQKVNISNCPLIETNELDCDKILIFPETCYPVVDVVDVVPGGQNTAGVYQFAICYSDVRANKLTDYFYVTNTIPLFDQPITIDTAYPVARSFKIQISNLNTDFRYFNLAVLKTINNVTSVYLIETFEVNSSNFEYIYTGVDKNLQADLSIDEIIAKRPYYNKAKITTENNGYLFLADLEEDRILNLQPVVSQIPLLWQTVEANDGDYADPIFAQNYVGYLGDEVYAFGISFTKNNGKQTNVFPFVNREATPYDLDDVSCFTCTDDYNLDCASGLPTPTGICRNPDVIRPDSCSTQKPELRWQVYNTAPAPSGVTCVEFDETQQPELIEEEIECVSNDVFYTSIINANTGIPGNIARFYLYPPPSGICNGQPVDYVYPPVSSEEAQNILCYLDQVGEFTIPNTPLGLPSAEIPQIGLCGCDTNNPAFAQYPNNAEITNIPFIFDLNDQDSSVDIIQEDTVFEIRTYRMFDELSNSIPKPSTYPTNIGPNPCLNYTGEKDYENGWRAWLIDKTNVSSQDPINIPQELNNSCSQYPTWGSFINVVDVNSNDANLAVINSESWYNFYATSQDGVAGIMISTDSNFIGYSSPNTPYIVSSNGDFNVVVHQTDASGNYIPTPLPFYNNTNPSPEPTTPYGVYKSTGNGVYILLKNLKYGSSYFINVIGRYTPPMQPGSVNVANCKKRTFRICVVTPEPFDRINEVIPGVARITRTCKVSYFGLPINNCKPSPDERGQFAYWESTETYPCNEQVWGDLAGKPIRHFKFPDNTSASISGPNPVPFFTEVGTYINGLSVRSNRIYPKGVTVDVNNIKNALNRAKDLGLITLEELSEICGYRIYRSNRRGNQSIIAKGLLYDVWQYRDNIYDTGNQVLFPNFPFNDNRPNEFIKNKKIKRFSQINDINFVRHPFGGGENNKYTFDAPNLSFNNPGLGTELKLEGEQTGLSIGSFPELRNNTKYQYIGAGIISAAIGFASVEAAFEAISVIATATLTLDITILGSGTTIPIGLIAAGLSENFLAPVRIYSHYAEWYEIIKKFAPFRNYAIYYTGVGRYGNIQSGNNTNVIQGNIRRTIANAQYIKPGILNVNTINGATRFNNFKRESSVFIELTRNSFFLSTRNQDISRPNVSDIPCETNPSYTGNLASYYASMKNPLVNQYGQIDNIQWIDTGYNGRINWDNTTQESLCDTIFGGDTYINRFTKKRKVPMFMEDRVIPTGATQVSPINQDIQLSLLPNIGYPRFWMDYPTGLDYSEGKLEGIFGDVAVQLSNKVDFNFLCFSSTGKSWKTTGLAAAIVGGTAAGLSGVISLGGVVGAISSIVKKKFGNDLFLKGNYVHSFYGITSFLCESDYNLDLRHGQNIKEKNFYPNVGDINEWTQEFFVPMYEDNYYFYNTDYSKQNTFNPNFVLNNDFKQTKEDCKVAHPNRLIYSLQDNDQNDKFDGNLIFLANNYYEFPKSGGKLLIVKGIENGKVLAIQENRAAVFNSYIALQTNVATATVGSNTLFNNQAPAQFVQTDLGFGGSQTPAIVSTEFGHFWVDNKRGQVLSIQQGIANIVKPEEEWWFKENLPFHILEDFPDFDITNNFKYVGMTITYDARFKRIIFTKRDVELKPQFKGLVTYDGTLFHYKDQTFTVEDFTYFCNKSWTISYSPLLKNFISFHTFAPNYYVPNQAYFSSGVNYSFDKDPNEYGLWHHNLTNKSYQVYYGKLEPFIFEFTISSKYQNKMLESVRYTAEFYRFQDNLSSGIVPNITYNKAILYNQKQTSGLLELVIKEKNNRRQYLDYPKQNINSRSILIEYVERGWQFNNFYDVYAENTGQPLMSYQCDNIAYKEINPLSISYKTQFLKKKMVSDYFVLRLINDKYSNYAINHRYSITKTQNINQ
jgi:hypothetical protein